MDDLEPSAMRRAVVVSAVRGASRMMLDLDSSRLLVAPVDPDSLEYPSDVDRERPALRPPPPLPLRKLSFIPKFLASCLDEPLLEWETDCPLLVRLLPFDIDRLSTRCLSSVCSILPAERCVRRVAIAFSPPSPPNCRPEIDPDEYDAAGDRALRRSSTCWVGEGKGNTRPSLAHCLGEEDDVPCVDLPITELECRESSLAPGDSLSKVQLAALRTSSFERTRLSLL